jgi:hypothetical protein
MLKNCEFKVSQTGRQRVIKEKRKNVHAGVVGDFVTLDICSPLNDNFTELYYNPYKHDSFVVKATGEAVSHAEMVILDHKRVFASGVRIK